MKKSITCLLATCALYPAVSFADIEIKPSNGVGILAINGKAVETKTFFSDLPELKAKNGTTQIVVEYTAEITESADDYVLEDSDTFVLTFKAADTTVRVQAPEISNRYDLKSFNRNADWRLLDDRGNPLSFTWGKLEKEGFQLGRDYEKELEEFNSTDTQAAVKSLNTETHSFNKSVPTSQPPSNVHPDQKMVGQMLEYWYEQASDETKNNFKNWLETGQ
ncbi:YccT family protein [Marinobacterium marinum]|uniref:UPF0319 protein H1S06_09515 n=1 Tax=Marinobacterium marinum TaxID=2756129 RepID=A0A7W1WYJ5_9GAMM|nr:DUF2057 domain-containing protein [Marinobacterium marinum]MBA4502599.1 DUF2057 domain-containing protein [Marinobacterium marinum]